MHLFNQHIAALINPYCKGEEIHYVGLGRWDFQFSFGDIRIQNEHKVQFFVENKEYVWEEGPNNIPVWALIGQIPERFTLDSSEILTMHLKGGNRVSFYTEESPYECCIIEFPRKDNNLVLEVF